MKIAICISGNLGSKKRSGERKNWNIKKQYSSKIDTTCFELLPAVRTT